MASFLLGRRTVIAATASLIAAAACSVNNGDTPMHGIIAKISTKPQDRDALAAILSEGTRNMPGCISYVIALDAKDETALWITEVWESADAHAASLKRPSVIEAIGKGRPLITGMEQIATTTPVTGA